MGRLDEIVKALGAAAPRPKLRDAARIVAEGDPYLTSRAGQIADELLRQPATLRRTEEFIGDHGLELGRHIGAGAESIVWEAVPPGGGQPHVLKIRPDSGSPGVFSEPPDVPGIVPYWAKAQPGTDVSAALQQKADVVYEKGRGLEVPFSRGIDRVKESLLARGWDWGDSHKWNLGVMPDGQWGVIDGFIYQAHPSWTRPQHSAEEAIRMLRVTPAERDFIYGPRY
jgi:hypothetical protein